MKKTVSLLLTVCLLAGMCTAAAASASDFKDIKNSDWYYSYVDYTVQRGLFSGTSPTAFSPKATLTRGMFVTVLGRYAGVSPAAAGTAKITETINMRSAPTTDSSIVKVLRSGDTVTVTGRESGWYRVNLSGTGGYVRQDLISVSSGKFSDVAFGNYCCPYVNWAAANGIASGTSDNTFSPNRAVSRQEICVFLYRYVQAFGIKLSETQAAVNFKDAGKINPSFTAAVTAMQKAGVVGGRTDGSFDPSGSATRAEAAAIITRFIQNIGENPKKDFSYAGTVKASAAVADGYFDDACFIGHSMVVGMRYYMDMNNADYYAVNGISAKRMLTYDQFTLADGETTGTLSAALAEKSYGKAYIMLGVNEMGTSDYDRQSFESSMRSLISLVKSSQPAAKIYIICILPVTRAESDSSANYNLDNIVIFNKLLQNISADTGAGYLDFFTLFADGDGYMPTECAASDGIHPVQSQYAVMRNYLKTHT